MCVILMLSFIAFFNTLKPTIKVFYSTYCKDYFICIGKNEMHIGLIKKLHAMY